MRLEEGGDEREGGVSGEGRVSDDPCVAGGVVDGTHWRAAARAVLDEGGRRGALTHSRFHCLQWPAVQGSAGGGGGEDRDGASH